MDVSKKRIEWIDTAKGLGILMVMLGHNYLDWKYVFWCYSFHMALFFFLSGCTFRDQESIGVFLKKRVWGLLIPYVFFAALIALYNWESAVTHGNSFDLSSAALSYLVQIRYTHLWFLPCLFLAEIGTWAIHKYLSKKMTANQNAWLFVAGIQLCLFFAYRAFVGIDVFWNADLAVLGMSFMSLGIWYHLNADAFVSDKCCRLPIVFFAIAFHLLVSWLSFTATESVDWYSNRFGNPILFFIGACAGIFATTVLSKRLHLKYLTYLGADSIVWYGLHRIIIDATFILYNKLHITIIRGSLLSLLLAIISVTISLILLIPVNIVLTKYFPFLIGKRKVRE